MGPSISPSPAARGATATVAAVGRYADEPQLREVALPVAEPGGLVVEVEATTVCGSDVHLWQGHYDEALDVELPFVPGHEIVGRVAPAGPGPELDSIGQELRPGDRVVWTPPPCRRCHTCVVRREPTLCPSKRMGMLTSCEAFPYVGGGFGTHAYVYPGSGRIRVPDEVRTEWACAASCAVRTAVSVLRAAGQIRPEHHVVVQGAGAVGLFATALAALQSPRTLTVVGAPQDRLDIARGWGADHVVPVVGTTADERAEALAEITERRGADVLLECSGAPTAFAEGLGLAGAGGRYVVAGTVGGPPQEISAHLVAIKGLRITGVFSADADAYWAALEVLRRHRGRFDWDLVFGRRYTLDQAGDALRAVQTGREIKPVIVV